jgi:hypothetical protein
MQPWAQCYKTFYSRKVTNFRNKLECLLLASLSSLVYCWWTRPGTYPRWEHVTRVVPVYAPALSTNTILFWKVFQLVNTLAYYNRTAVETCIQKCVTYIHKKFYNIDPSGEKALMKSNVICG